jgi:transcription initiation factor TFIIIB Brf1 subunit/transcription initiation factor TFIIB
LTDKKAALTALFNASEARLKLMLARQTNFMDPYLEKLILDNRKEQHAILKTISTLSDQLSKDSEKDWLGEATSLVQVVLAAVYNAYRLCHTDQSHFSEFAGKVDVSITDYLKAYPTARENLNKNKKETK